MPFSSFGGVTEAQIESAGGLVAENNLSDLDDVATARTNLGALGGALGANDNRALRSDGTGGATAQGSDLIITDDRRLANLLGLSFDLTDNNLPGSGTIKNYAPGGGSTLAWHDGSNVREIYHQSGRDVAVADGGTGASDATNARTNLGLAIGSDVQPYGATLASLEGLSLASGDILYATGADALARLAGVDRA